MQPKRARLIVGWRQVPVAKVRVRPVRGVTPPPAATLDPRARLPDPAAEKDGEGE